MIDSSDFRRLAGCMLLAALLAGCGGGTQGLPGEEAAPDVVTFDPAPLALPPNYGLRPADDGGDAAHANAAQRILGRSWNAARAEGGEAPRAPAGPPTATAALRERLGLDEADPGIRTLLDDEARGLSLADGYPVETLLCWPASPAGGSAALCTPGQADRRADADAARPEIERVTGSGLGSFF